MRRGIGHLRAGGFWSPALLFSSGAQGTWFDPADFSTLYQDSAGSTPVTATGQPVGKILDKSGRGNHATQATATSRPTLQQDASGYYYLSFDGVDDSLATAAVNFTTTQQATIVAGVMKSSDAAVGCVASLYNGGTSGTFNLKAPGGTNAHTYSTQLSATGTNGAASSTYTAPVSNVVTGAVDLSQSLQASQIAMRVNAAVQTLAFTGVAATPQSGFVNQPLGVGFAVGGTNFFNGRIYGLVVVGASVADPSIAERFIGQRMGIAL